VTISMISFVEVDGWRSGIRFSSAHMIKGHEKCGKLHGHTYAIHARVYGEKDKDGFIVDFSMIKSALRKIADQLDHKVLIPEKNTSFDEGEKEIKISINEKHYVIPKEDCFLLPIESVTVENLAEYVLDELIDRLSLPKNIKKLEIGVDEGFGQGAKIIRSIG